MEGRDLAKGNEYALATRDDGSPGAAALDIVDDRHATPALDRRAPVPRL